MKSHIQNINQNHSFEMLHLQQVVIEEHYHNCIIYLGSKKLDSSSFYTEALLND